MQRSRKRGYRTPEGTIYVGRPTIFGNPFHTRRFGHVRSVRLYARWVAGNLSVSSLAALGFSPTEVDALVRWRHRLMRRTHELRGKPLQCWCPVSSRWCHADILLALANAPRTPLEEAA